MVYFKATSSLLSGLQETHFFPDISLTLRPLISKCFLWQSQLKPALSFLYHPLLWLAQVSIQQWQIREATRSGLKQSLQREGKQKSFIVTWISLSILCSTLSGSSKEMIWREAEKQTMCEMTAWSINAWTRPLSHSALDNTKILFYLSSIFFSLKLLFLLSLKQSPEMARGNSGRRKWDQYCEYVYGASSSCSSVGLVLSSLSCPGGPGGTMPHFIYLTSCSLWTLEQDFAMLKRVRI